MVGRAGLLKKVLLCLFQDQLRFEFQIISRNEFVFDSIYISLKAVIVARLAVAVGVDDFGCAVFFGDSGEAAFLLADAGRGIMQEHNVFGEAGRLCLFKRDAQAL